MRIAGVDHVVLYADDVEALAGFYADVLDAPVVEYGDGWLSVRFRAGAVNVRPADGDFDLVNDAPTVGAGDFCLVAETSIEAVVERLESKGVEVVEGPVERPGARGPMTSVYFSDPEGNLAEVATYPDG